MFKIVTSLLLGVLASSCANPPRPALARQPVKSISVIPATNPPTITVLNLSALAFLVPISQTFNYMDASKKQQVLNEALSARAVNYGAALTDCVVAELRKRHYVVELLEPPTRPSKNPDDIDYDRLDWSTDAVLHVRFNEVGIFSPRSTTNYLPRVNAQVTLLLKSQKEELFDENVAYGVDARAGKEWEILADPAYLHPDFDSVMGDLNGVQHAFDVGTRKVCERIAEKVNAAAK